MALLEDECNSPHTSNSSEGGLTFIFWGGGGGGGGGYGDAVA